ncbi:MAG: hypothetical protein LAT82_01450 [Nanoarchaeota archaeon]|nr:hypothetical protein [Nanoarchaeota archaeon]
MKYLSGKDKKSLQEQLPPLFNIDKKDEIIEFKDVLFKNKNPILIKSQAIKNLQDNQSQYHFIPHLKSSQIKEYKTITIDVGAVPFLLKGADMMRPGITNIDNLIKKDDIIIIVDEVKGLRIGIGQSLYDSVQIKEMKSGKIIKTLHYFKDDFYNIML